MNTIAPATQRVMVIGAAGFLGQGVLRALIASPTLALIVAADVRPLPDTLQDPRLVRLELDVRDPDLEHILLHHRIDTVVHLAAIVTPGANSSLEKEYSVDVGGTRNVMEACLGAHVQHIVVSSSGAAYGYHADNPAWIDESQAIRGNESFGYSNHKRLIEEMLVQYRRSSPQLMQTVLRIGTVLGEHVDNQITALFEKRRLLAIRGSDSPFVFIWDEDVVGAIIHALSGHARPGCYNVAGDGALTISDIGKALNKPLMRWPAEWLRLALRIGARLELTRYGPEQLDFLRYRPVLLNTALKTKFGYTPAKTSAQAFEAFIDARARQGRPVKRG